MTKVMNAPAKINIFLDIVGKLDNGYHSLFMVMQAVSLCDKVTITTTQKGITIKCSTEGVPLDEKNTAYKAAKYFFEYTGIESGAEIEIEKNIPHEAGLAGGSSDAAAVINGLDEIFETKLTLQQKYEIGLKVGSDVPFCITGGICLSQNTGGILSPLKPLKECSIVLVKPDRGVSTPKAYEDADNTYIYHPDCLKMLDACEKGDFDLICKLAGNVFEQVVEVPERVDIKRIMREHNVSLAQMSGSGPTVFGIFLNEEDAMEAAKELKKTYKNVFVTKPL